VKNGIVILILAVGLAVCSFVIYYRTATAAAAAMLSKPQGEMEWLKMEFHLTETQFARIQELHREYAPKCDEMCEDIANENLKLDALIRANHMVTAEVNEALSECVAVQGNCRRALLGHVYAVSAEMSPTDGNRYVQMMKQRIIEPALGNQTLISQSTR
jgi:hypothetical protein